MSGLEDLSREELIDLTRRLVARVEELSRLWAITLFGFGDDLVAGLMQFDAHPPDELRSLADPKLTSTRSSTEPNYVIGTRSAGGIT